MSLKRQLLQSHWSIERHVHIVVSTALLPIASSYLWMYVCIHTCTRACNCTIYWNLHLSFSVSKSIFISVSATLFLSIHCRYLSKNEILLLVRFLFFFIEEHVIDIFSHKIQTVYMFLFLCKIYYEKINLDHYISNYTVFHGMVFHIYFTKLALLII